MLSPDITPQEILDAIQRVPTDRWGEVLNVIESLQSSHAPAAPTLSPVRTGIDLCGSELIGIWSDRTDLGNGHEFARRLRQIAEQRGRQGSSDVAGH